MKKDNMTDLLQKEIRNKVVEIFNEWGYGSNSDKEICITEISNLFTSYLSSKKEVSNTEIEDETNRLSAIDNESGSIEGEQFNACDFEAGAKWMRLKFLSLQTEDLEELKEGEWVYCELSGYGQVTQNIPNDFCVKYINEDCEVEEDLKNVRKITAYDFLPLSSNNFVKDDLFRFVGFYNEQIKTVSSSEIIFNNYLIMFPNNSNSISRNEVTDDMIDTVFPTRDLNLLTGILCDNEMRQEGAKWMRSQSPVRIAKFPTEKSNETWDDIVKNHDAYADLEDGEDTERLDDLIAFLKENYNSPIRLNK